MSTSTVPFLTIIVVSYNHEAFIREALESILAQDHDFSFEVLLADDCSPDSTRDILNEYAARYPETFIPFFARRNLGITANYKRAFAAARGEYVAILEGDDYWTSRTKLRRQVDFLRDNTAFSMAASAFAGRHQDSGKTVFPVLSPTLYSCGGVTCLTTEDLIEANVIGNFSTCVYRKKVLDALDPGFFSVTAYDWLINLAVSESGPIAYFQEPLSVYRILPDSTWSSKTPAERAGDILACVQCYDTLFESRYSEAFAKAGAHWASQADKTALSGLAARLKRVLPKSVYRFACRTWDRLHPLLHLRGRRT